MIIGESPFARIRRVRTLVVAARSASDTAAASVKPHHLRAFCRDCSRELTEALLQLDDLAADLFRGS